MKELTQKQKGALILGGIFLVILVLVVTMMAPAMRKDPEEEKQEPSVHQTIPDPNGTETPVSKSEGYRRSNGNIGDYWDSLQPDGEDDKDDLTSGKDSDAPIVQTVDELFGPNEGKGTGTARSGGKAPARKAPEKPKEEGSVAGSGAAAPPPAPKPQVKRSSAISSLDEDVTRNLGNGFSSLDVGDSYVSSDEGHPYKCMFTRSEKVRSGQRISVRLLEDIIIGGVLIPQNTHLSAVCTLSGRMNITITSLEIRGTILKFKLEGYDTDGAKGIYCSDLGDTKKRITEQGLSTTMSSLNSRLGKVANDATELGASIIRSKTGEVTVEIPAGYVFYVIESKEK